MVSAIYICHWPDVDDEFSRCELLIHRNYHNSVPPAAIIIDAYSRHYHSLGPALRTPILCHQGINYISYWGDDNILLLAVSQTNCCPMSTVSLLHKFYRNIVHYFEQSMLRQQRADASISWEPFCRESIVDNYSLIYELLDECVDFGVVQVTDFSILKEYIRMEINHSRRHDMDSDSDSDSDSLLSTAKNPKSSKSSNRNKGQKHSDIKSTHNRAIQTDVNQITDSINSSVIRTQVSAVSWRPKGIFYPKNEIYVDIIETCDFLYDLETKEIRTNQIYGNCLVRSYLSGMPVCKLGLNEKYISRIVYDDEELNPPTDSEPAELPGNLLTGDAAEPEEAADTEDAQISTQKGVEKTIENATLGTDPDSTEVEKEPAKSTDIRKLRVPITNVQFHSCIELSRIYKENLIFFTPPDEEFQLLSYRVEQQKRKSKAPLLLVDPTYRIIKQENKLQILCSLSTNYKKKLHAQKTVVSIPIDTQLFQIASNSNHQFRFKCELGEVRFKVDTSEILWAIGDLPGSKKVVRMMAEVGLESCDLSVETMAKNLHQQNPPKEEESDEALSELDSYYGVAGAQKSSLAKLRQNVAKNRHHVSVSFQIPMLTYSGLKVIYLRVDEDTMKYTCFPWVRYMTQAQGGQKNRESGGEYRFKLGPSNFTVV